MNQITTIDQTSITTPFQQWIEIGRDLIAARRQADWKLADWWNDGRSRFHDEPQFQFMAEQMAADPKRLTQMAKVAEAFPPHTRASNLNFEVHREIASVGADDRLELLAKAAKERWSERTAHQRVTAYRYDQGSLLPDDDPENRLAVEIIRAWNRATPEAREYAWERIRHANFGSINEGEVIDA